MDYHLRRHRTSFEHNSRRSVSVQGFMFWVSLGALILSLPLMVNLLSRLQAEERMRAEVERRRQEVMVLESHRANVLRALEYARSEAFVEAWARSQRWARPGEVPVAVPLNSDEQREPWWQPFIAPTSAQPER